MKRTIPVTVDVEIDGAGCGEGCYALIGSDRSGFILVGCMRYKTTVALVKHGEPKKPKRCADCIEEFGE